METGEQVRIPGRGAPTFRLGIIISTTGGHLAMKIVLEAAKPQPCYPTINTAWNAIRDAIRDAGKILASGENTCKLWKAFLMYLPRDLMPPGLSTDILKLDRGNADKR